jgi:hypothetical protein
LKNQKLKKIALEKAQKVSPNNSESDSKSEDNHIAEAKVNQTDEEGN